MKKVYLITTMSGSRYRILSYDTGTWLERIPSNDASVLRRDGERIKIYKILQLILGKPAVFVLEPLGIGDVTIRETTAVIEVKTVNK